jgi:hypothetical protein
MASFVAAIPANTATPPPTDIATARERQLGEIVTQENEKTRAWLDDFGTKTAAEIQRQEKQAIKDVNATLLKFKFTLAVVVFSSILAALEMHDLLRRRRDRLFKRLMDADAAQRAKDSASTEGVA